MIALRELPMFGPGVLSIGQEGQPKPLSLCLQNFCRAGIARRQATGIRPDRKIWQLDCGQHPFTTTAEFLAFDQPDVAKLTVGFQLEQLGDHRTRLVTESRARQRILSSIRRSMSMAAS